MKIRRLEICGFKSFADRVVFAFDDGVTGVVGPNGCGKSNVVDAIRWAMGEQSAKHLRGRSMEDVIFAGSESRPATGMAEVSLTFQNDGRLVPAQYTGFGEITVTRRLFRNGDSDYEINKTPCRLLDITELFLGTGQTDFSPLNDGQTLQLERGPQGGHHIWIAARMKNLRQSGSRTTLTAKLVGTTFSRSLRTSPLFSDSRSNGPGRSDVPRP